MKRCSLIHNQTEQNRSTHRMSRTFLPALLLYGLSLVSVLVSQFRTMVVRTGDTITLQCSNVTTAVGHTAWFKQVNGSEPVCISSMYGFRSTPDLHNGFQRSHLEMFSNKTTIFLKITNVEIADCGLYFCGLYPQTHMFFVNATVLKIQEDDDGTMYLLPLVVILGVVTAVLLIVILILVLKIRRDTKTTNTDQDPDSLNYAALSFRQKRSRNKKMAKGQTMEMESNVVYAATR
uniref:Ig-like domain-containing protein n=1 Tax=Hucho hucho TaxID=62062 RepID=A0A4W5PCV1_9TELE